MPKLIISLIFLIFITKISAKITANWLSDNFKAGVICKKSSFCRVFSHFIYTVTSEDVTHNVITGSMISIDNGDYFPGNEGKFESHLVNGTCAGTTCTKGSFDDCTCEG